MYFFLEAARIRLLDFTDFVERATAGFRNRDLRCLLHPGAALSSPDHIRRLSARVRRRLRLCEPKG